MDQSRFEGLARWVATASTRRVALRALIAAPLATTLAVGLPGSDSVAEPDRRRVRGEHNRRKDGKKTIMCYEGKTVRVSTNQRKKWLRKGATRGKCSGCTPVCTPGECGADDSCGGICGCDAGSICGAGLCQSCSVTCTGDAATCGAALEAELIGGGDIYLCPGRYAPSTVAGFLINVNTNLYGAGNGDDPTVDSILDAQGAANSVVLQIDNAVTAATLAGLRITGGDGPQSYPGGVYSNSNDMLNVQDCAIVGNLGSAGGGMYLAGPMTMTGSLVSGNTSNGYGGGMYIEHSTNNQTTTISDSVISQNTGRVGGIYFYTTHNGDNLVVESTSQVIDNISTNAPGNAGGIEMAGGTPGTANATGAQVSGNTDPQCIGVTGC